MWLLPVVASFPGPKSFPPPPPPRPPWPLVHLVRFARGHVDEPVAPTCGPRRSSTSCSKTGGETLAVMTFRRPSQIGPLLHQGDERVHAPQVQNLLRESREVLLEMLPSTCDSERLGVPEQRRQRRCQVPRRVHQVAPADTEPRRTCWTWGRLGSASPGVLRLTLKRLPLKRKSS